MSLFNHPIVISASLTRSVAIAALMGTTILASPLTSARADMSQHSSVRAPIRLVAATKTKGETVEQRITSLHKALKITADEETLWNGVAQAMRENATAMDKLFADTQATPPQTAVEDLKVYQQIAQAHVDGLKNLIASFDALYATMPDTQKKVADNVFRTSGPKGMAHRK
ncbi:MAG TPA: Spy/CpxP family protein refolding chaperone [Stellaceae bacterium]|nr:Spy/CpxP family protein refolding chaperone [Stellaceae bacterium]